MVNRIVDFQPSEGVYKVTKKIAGVARREFLKNAALAAGAVGLAGLADAKESGAPMINFKCAPMLKIRVGSGR